MRFCKVDPVIRKPPPGRKRLNVPESGALGFTEATSNFTCVAGDWPNTCPATQNHQIPNDTVFVRIDNQRRTEGDKRGGRLRRLRRTSLWPIFRISQRTHCGTCPIYGCSCCGSCWRRTLILLS